MRVQIEIKNLDQYKQLLEEAVQTVEKLEKILLEISNINLEVCPEHIPD